MDFAFITMFYEGPEDAPLEKFFRQVHRKLELYKRHAQVTTELYRTEYSEQLNQHRGDFKAEMVETKKVYDKVYAETAGSDYDKYSLANHESDMSGIENRYTTAEQDLAISFTEMSQHFNKASLIQIYALLESELRRFCALLTKTFKLRLTLDRLEDGDYLQSIFDYLNLVAELDLTKLLPFQNKFKELQFLRNRLMHNGGEFSMTPQEPLDYIVNSSDDLLVLINLEDEPIRILQIRRIEYVNQYYDLIAEFFYHAFFIVSEKIKFELLSQRIAYLFSFLSNAISVNYLEHKTVKNGYQFIFRVDSNDFENLFAFNCKLTLTKAHQQELIITSQVDETDLMTRLIKQLKLNPNELSEKILQGFTPPGHSLKIEMMLYP